MIDAEASYGVEALCQQWWEKTTDQTEVAQEEEIGQSLCILLCLLLDSNRSKVRIIYAPQENVTWNNDLKQCIIISANRHFNCPRRKPSSNIGRLHCESRHL